MPLGLDDGSNIGLLLGSTLNDGMKVGAVLDETIGIFVGPLPGTWLFDGEDDGLPVGLDDGATTVKLIL